MHMRARKVQKAVDAASCVCRAGREKAADLISGTFCPGSAPSCLPQASDIASQGGHEHAHLFIVLFGTFSLRIRYLLQKRGAQPPGPQGQGPFPTGVQVR